MKAELLVLIWICMKYLDQVQSPHFRGVQLNYSKTYYIRQHDISRNKIHCFHRSKPSQDKYFRSRKQEGGYRGHMGTANYACTSGRGSGRFQCGQKILQGGDVWYIWQAVQEVRLDYSQRNRQKSHRVGGHWFLGWWGRRIQGSW